MRSRWGASAVSVLSIEPSSETISSSGGSVCVSADSTASEIDPAALCAAITTEKVGGASSATSSLLRGARIMREAAVIEADRKKVYRRSSLVQLARCVRDARDTPGIMRVRRSASGFSYYERDHPAEEVTSTTVRARRVRRLLAARNALQWNPRLRRLRRPAFLGTIRRTTPLSDHWGRERGTPVDRYYIEHFLAGARHTIRGCVLEVMNADYTERFGAGVERSDVLDIDPTNAAATIVADLANADDIPGEIFDCFILTQTLQYIYDIRSAVGHAHRILRPGGTLLCTVPTVSRIARRELESEYWRLTAAACSRLFGEVFTDGVVDVRARGNVLSAVAFLVGMAREELSPRELDLDDPFFPVIVTVQARKAA
jgi:hypothetical protein